MARASALLAGAAAALAAGSTAALRRDPSYSRYVFPNSNPGASDFYTLKFGLFVHWG
jgi:hypothetical protein